MARFNQLRELLSGIRNLHSNSRISTEREPYFVQIGFDFGTAFCKCVCRDVNLDKAWVHIPPHSVDPELPFLISSSARFDGQHFTAFRETGPCYGPGLLQHVKMALEHVGQNQWDDPSLAAYRDATSNASREDVSRLVELCAIYVLAGALGNVKDDITQRFPGNCDDDYMTVNMAVPVADANHPNVVKVFEKVFRAAWALADQLCDHPPISFEDLRRMREENGTFIESEQVKEACYLYPEVSANVQGFVRSRNSLPGVYLFSDTGAGTVDQSLFLFDRPDEKDTLTYLSAQVLPLGSNLIERKAAAIDGEDSWENLESWRRKKEAGELSPELSEARNGLKKELLKGTSKTIAAARKKLRVQPQMDRLRVIFGGGGHCTDPYSKGVIEVFDGPLFQNEPIKVRRDNNEPFELGMPYPKDLSLSEKGKRWMDRLTVAYGLSFVKEELARFWLPDEVDTPTEEQIWRPRRQIAAAPSKDVV